MTSKLGFIRWVGILSERLLAGPPSENCGYVRVDGAEEEGNGWMLKGIWGRKYRDGKEATKSGK